MTCTIVSFLKNIRLTTSCLLLANIPVIKVSLKITFNDMGACLAAASLAFNLKPLTLCITARVKAHILIIAKKGLYRMIRAHIKRAAFKAFVTSDAFKVDNSSIHFPKNHWPFKFFSRPHKLHKFVGVPRFVNYMFLGCLSEHINVNGLSFSALLPFSLRPSKQLMAVRTFL